MGEVLYNLNVTNKRGLISVGCYIVPLRDVLYQWNKVIFQLDATNDYLCWGFPVHVAMHFIKVYIIEFAYIFMKWSLNLYRQNSCEESNSETKIKIRENDVKLKPLRDIIAYCVLPPKGQTGQSLWVHVYFNSYEKAHNSVDHVFLWIVFHFHIFRWERRHVKSTYT